MTAIAELVTRHDGRIDINSTLAEAARKMLAARISSVIVVEANKVVGIVTESDMLHAMREHRALDRPVSDVMTSPVHSVPADMDFREAYRAAARLGIRHIVVTDENDLAIGVASETEFRQHLGPDFFRQLNTVDLLMEHLFPRLPPEASLESALAVMDAARASCTVVVEDRQPIGILTERDVVRLFLKAEDNPPVSEVMTRPAITVAEHTSLAYAADLMRSQGIRHLVVVDDNGHATGLLSEHTLMRPLEIDMVDDVVHSGRTRQKKSDESLLLRNAALAGLIRGENLHGALDLIALSVETEMASWRCSVMLVDETGERLEVGAGPRLPEAYTDAISSIPIGEGVGSCGTSAFRRQRVVVEDIFTSPLWVPYRQLAEIGQFAACWSDPILGPDGELLGTFAAYHATPSQPDEGQLELLAQGTQLAALILTHQRRSRQLKDSQSTFRGIFDSISEAVLILSQHGTILDANREAIRLGATAPERLIGRHYSEFSVPGMNDHGAIDAQIATAFAGQPQTFEFWALNGEGRHLSMEVRLTPGAYFGQRILIASITEITDRKLASLRLEIEHDLAEMLARGTTRDALLNAILETTLRYPELDAGAIYEQLPDGSFQMLAHAGLSAAYIAATQHYPVDHVVNQMLRSGKPACSCQDAGAHCSNNSLADAPLSRAEGLLCLLTLPIVAEHSTIAALVLASQRTSQLSESTLLGLEGISITFAQTLARLHAIDDARRQQNNLAGLFDTLDDLIFVIAPDGRIIHYNPAVNQLLGYPPGALIGQAMSKLHPAHLRTAAKRQADAMLSGRASSEPLPLLRADGHTLMADTRIIEGYWNGQPALFAILQDITERLVGEERQRLAASVFDNAHEGIMITDPTGRIVEVNSTFTDLTGYPRHEALGQTAGLLNSGHHDAEFYRNMWQSINDAGFWRGEVWNRKKTGEIFVELLTISTVRDGAGSISHFVGIFSDITLLKQHQQRLEHLAHFDALTQLPNRMLLSDRLELAMAQCKRNHRLLAICYLDLDGFKPVNDQYGHSVGDRLLVDVSLRLKGCVRAGDTVSRLGGDEFVMLFSELNDLNECDHAVARVINTLARPFQVSGHLISISASIGVTLYPHDGADADTLLRHADQAMYVAKQSGRNRFHLFDPESDRRARSRRESLQQIADGLARNEFVLHYQPKVDMRAGRVIGAEALIRWQHPERGLLLPQHFLPAVEGSELAITLGEWVIRTSLRQLAAWQAEGLAIDVSINIAGEHLQHAGFAERLAELIAEVDDVDPHHLELEVLETAALEDIGKVAGLIEACRELGVRFSLDDFGTGYSSLTYFRRLPADTLKIDQSFVRDMLVDPEDLAIVEGVIGLTQAFHRKVIAEGVETPDHCLVLLLLGCDLAQGFGIARPMPANTLPGWVQHFTPDPMWRSAVSGALTREDLPMLVASCEHRRWMNEIHACLTSSNPLAEPCRDHRCCGFGLWYYGADSRRYADHPVFVQLGTLHHELHNIGTRILDLHQAGEKSAAETLLPRLEATSQALSDGLAQLSASS